MMDEWEEYEIRDGVLRFPDGCQSIVWYNVRENTDLRKVVIPNTITYLAKRCLRSGDRLECVKK